MDAVDQTLLDALRANARSTFAELGRIVGLSAPSVHERVAKLEAAGILRGYHASVAPEALGFPISALMSVFLTDRAEFDVVNGALAAISAIEDCWFVAGEESYVIKVRVPDVAGLEQLIGAINQVAGVARTRTTVVLSTKFEARVPIHPFTGELPPPV